MFSCGLQPVQITKPSTHTNRHRSLFWDGASTALHWKKPACTLIGLRLKVTKHHRCICHACAQQTSNREDPQVAAQTILHASFVDKHNILHASSGLPSTSDWNVHRQSQAFSWLPPPLPSRTCHKFETDLTMGSLWTCSPQNVSYLLSLTILVKCTFNCRTTLFRNYCKTTGLPGKKMSNNNAWSDLFGFWYVLNMCYGTC